jgi:hypothetical protein
MAVLAPDQRDVLERGPQHMYLFVNTAGAGPIGYPMTGIFDREALWFTTYRAAAKVRHLLADSRVCCLFAPPATDEVTDSILSVRGHAVPSDDTSAFSAPRTDAPLEVPPEIREKVVDRLDTGKRLVFRVQIEAASSLPVDPAKEGLHCRVPISR